MQSPRLSQALAMLGASLVALGVWAFGGTSHYGAPTAIGASVGAPPATRISSGAVSDQKPLAGVSALEPSAAGADPLQVEPRIPRAAGTPCVVDMGRNFPITESFWVVSNYAPPPDCPGPYAKITLAVELTGPREDVQPSANIQLFLGSPDGSGTYMTGALFAGAPQITDDIGVWRMERDLTEYAALFNEPRAIHFPAAIDNRLAANTELEPSVRSVKLILYPATAATPAQRVADMVLPLPYLPITFPRNIERAYVDIMAKPFNAQRALGGPGAQRYWYACAPQEAWQAFPILQNYHAIGDYRSLASSALQGCGGGSFREVEILIDGQLAGLAPVFPWLGSNIGLPGAVDDPAPSVQALNMVPFRVDLTPFAGLLNDGAEHTVQARMVGGNAGFVSGHLLLYLDKDRAVVPGAVIRNTLAEQPAAPVVTSTLAQTTDAVGPYPVHHLTGQATTRSTRAFRIEGYVDTSRGRITSTVVQTNRFVNTLTYDVTGPDPVTTRTDFDTDFLQKVRLSSTVDRTARRMLGTTLLSEDKLYSSYPLILDYHNAGKTFVGDDYTSAGIEDFSLRVHQARGMRSSQYRRGTPRYETSLADIFDGSRDHSSPVLGGVGDSNWASRRSYLFTDNRAGCYSAGLTTANRMLTSRTRGEACPNGRNGLRWYSHPDGSPDSMGWAPQP